LQEAAADADTDTGFHVEAMDRKDEDLVTVLVAVAAPTAVVAVRLTCASRRLKRSNDDDAMVMLSLMMMMLLLLVDAVRVATGSILSQREAQEFAWNARRRSVAAQDARFEKK
jgi:hypothetical protein